MKRAASLSNRLACTVALLLATFAGSAQAYEVDPGLAIALDGVWQQSHPAVSVLSSTFTQVKESDPPRYSTEVTRSPTYVTGEGEEAQIEYLRKRYPANDSPWGPLPPIDTGKAKLLELNLANRRYLAISAPGGGLYAAGDWQRFGFLYVLDVSSRSKPLHYALVAEADLREKVLGRLPDSPVLNYARLVPSRWASNTQVNAYEVLLYALNPKGPERVVRGTGKLSYLLSRRDDSAPWTLQRIDATPIADERDATKRSFSAPPTQGTMAAPPAAVSVADDPAANASVIAPPVAPTPATSAPASSAPVRSAHSRTTRGDTVSKANSGTKGAAKERAGDALTPGRPAGNP